MGSVASLLSLFQASGTSATTTAQGSFAGEFEQLLTSLEDSTTESATCNSSMAFKPGNPSAGGIVDVLLRDLAQLQGITSETSSTQPGEIL